ncbi:ABC transporter permease [Brachybacterium sp. YJGR34]|uniref:ABC transporter permease n=1 Tax=Brachybacterium sp. YJGR34 TaxID=2059911 RepID=UPI00130091C6|nr:ABC transporter permease [Brachybacterium sp. YJGR34]
MRTAAPPRWPGPGILVIPPLVFVVIMFAVPLVQLAQLSLRPSDAFNRLLDGFTTENFRRVLSEPYFADSISYTVVNSAVVTLACAVIAFPLSWVITRTSRRWLKVLVFMVVISPMLTSVVVRSYGWRIVLSSEGPVNSALLGLGLVEQPLALLTSRAGSVISIVHVLLPFFVLMLNSTLKALDESVLRAAQALGAGPIRRLMQVILPLSVPGFVGGAIVVFSLSMGIYVTPLLIGGVNQPLGGLRVYTQVMTSFDYPTAAALSFVLLAISLIVAGLLSAVQLVGGKRIHG